MIADWSDRIAAVACLAVWAAGTFAWLRWCDR
jgi:hypothetical protein